MRAFRADWSPTLALSYAAVADEAPWTGEPGQPAQWRPVDSPWATWFPEDEVRVARHVAVLRDVEDASG